MNSMIAATFAVLFVIATVSAGYDDGYKGDNYGYGGYQGGYGGRYGYGFERTGKGVEAVYNNAKRQVRVNKIAEHVGASSGTFFKDGVPGTGKYFPNDRYYGKRGY